MSSRSIVSGSNVAALIILVALLALGGVAEAGRRLVVLEFDGPKAEKFRDEVEAAVKKGNTIVSLGKWNARADDLRATKVTARNVKKVARTLKVDGVIVGEIEKRGPRYYVHLRLREGATGDYVAEVEIVVRQGKLGKEGNRVIKDELLPAIKELSTIRGGGDDEAEDEEAEDEEPVARKNDRKKGKKKSGFGRKAADEDEDEDEDDEAEEEDDEEDEPVAKKKKGKAEKPARKEKKVAARTEKKVKAKKVEEEEEEEAEEEEADDEEEVALREDGDDGDDGDGEEARIEERVDEDDGEPAPRDLRMPALEAAVGLSATARRLGFTTAQGVAPVQGYQGNPVAGAMVTVDVFPLAFQKKNRSITRNFGLTVLFDRVLKIESRLEYDDNGTPATAVLPTTQQRYALGLVYRHPIGQKMSVEGSVRYNRMKFAIDASAAPAGVVVQIPSVDYAFIDPGVAVKYVVSPKMLVDGGLSVGIVQDTGAMQEPDQYGTATVLGIGVGGGLAYFLTDAIAIRGDLQLTTFGFSFTGDGMLSNPDADATVDVPSGRDTYYGASAAAAYRF